MLTENELGIKLKEMYEVGCPKKEAVTFIHLFGIKYADDIRSNRLNVAELIKVSGISPTYITEINKGIKLSKYVEIKRTV